MFGFLSCFMLGMWVQYHIDSFKDKEESLEAQERVIDANRETIDNLLKEDSTTGALVNDINERVVLLQYHIEHSTGDTTGVNEESIKQCKQLLSQGSELLKEGSKLLRDTNKRLDTFININNLNNLNKDKKYE